MFDFIKSDVLWFIASGALIILATGVCTAIVIAVGEIRRKF